MSGAVRKGTLVVYIEQVVNAICSFLISVLLARFFSTSDFGLWKLFASVTILVTYASSFGIEVSLIRYIPEFLIKNQFLKINKLISVSVGVRSLFLVLLFSVVYLLRVPIDRLFNTGLLFQDLIVPTFGYLIIYHLNTLIGRAVLTAYGKRYVLGYIKITTKVISLVGIYFVADLQLGFKEVLYVLLFIQIIELIVFLFLSGKKIKFNLHQKSTSNTSKLPYRRILAFALPNYFFLSGQVFREYTIDNLVISHYLSLEAVAFYGIAIAFPTYFRNFSPGRILHGILLPEFVKKYAKHPSNNILQEDFAFIQKITIFFMWPVYLIFIFLAQEIITFIYGEAYVYSVLPAQMLLVFSVVQTMADPFYLICNTIEKSTIILQTMIWGFINLLGNLLLVPILGIIGAALSTGLISVFIYMHFYFVLKTKMKLDLRFPLRASVIVLIGLIPSLLALITFHIASLNIYLLVLIVGLSLLLYLIFIILSGFFNKQETHIFLRLFKINSDSKLYQFITYYTRDQ